MKTPRLRTENKGLQLALDAMFWAPLAQIFQLGWSIWCGHWGCLGALSGIGADLGFRRVPGGCEFG